MTEALINEDELRFGELDFDIPLSKFNLAADYYATLDENDAFVYNIDCVFTDSWYAYCLMYICDSDVADLEAAGELFGKFLSSGTYVGNPPRFDLVQLDATPSDTTTSATKPPATEPPATESTVTKGMKNALSSAKSYLRFMSFSYNGLVDQLEYEGYSNDEAVYAADNCGANWNEQALKSAEDYLDFSAFSYSGLMEQLEYEQFTTSQAKYAADNCGADWYEQAAKSAEDYMDFMSYSRSEMIAQLEYEGFTRDQAEYGADSVGLT